MCVCNTGNDNIAHFYLHCPLFIPISNDLLGQLSCLPEMDLNNINPKALLNLLLSGSPTLKESDNRIIIEASIAYIKATKRFNQKPKSATLHMFQRR